MEYDEMPDLNAETGELPVIPQGYFDVHAAVISPEYEVSEASAKVELYTLKEAVADERIVDMLAPLLSSGIVEMPAEAYSRGLVVFAQPQLDENGESYVHSAHLKATVTTISQDVMVIIARTGARANVTLDIEGKAKLSRQLIILAQEDVRLKIHSIAKDSEAGNVIQKTLIIAGAGSEITIENLGISNEEKHVLAGGATVNV